MTIRAILGLSLGTEHRDLAREHGEDATRTTAALAALAQELDEAKSRADQLAAAVAAAAARVMELEARRRALAQAYDVRVSRREKRLRETADPRIDAFLDELEALRGALRHQILRTEGLGPRDARTLRRPTVHGSNLDQVQARATAIGLARERAEALKLEHVPDLAARLAEIRATIPALDDRAVQAS